MQTPARCGNMWPAWSPDGRQVVFASDRTGDSEIYVRAIGGDADRQLTTAPGRDAHPSFGPDGRQIAFQSPREGGHTNLYVMKADGTDLRRVTNHTGFAGMPVWSPDGTHLAYQWTPDLEREKWRLMMVTLSTGDVWQLTDGAANDQVINWGPTGRLLVFHSDRDGRNQLFTMTNRGAVTRLTTTDSDDRSSAFSPDGRQIAFMSDRDGPPHGIYIMNADGTGARRLGRLAPGHGVPFFSPDGQFVLATLQGAGGQDIHRVRVTDGQSERLVSCPAASGELQVQPPCREPARSDLR
ncbi:MAG TPA: hypothetical protein VMM93_10125 [Vicinamibacterales bacterium]|nr:hypothetical protein [Vicinamibacterales bacterium]